MKKQILFGPWSELPTVEVAEWVVLMFNGDQATSNQRVVSKRCRLQRR